MAGLKAQGCLEIEDLSYGSLKNFSCKIPHGEITLLRGSAHDQKIELLRALVSESRYLCEQVIRPSSSRNETTKTPLPTYHSLAGLPPVVDLHSLCPKTNARKTISDYLCIERLLLELFEKHARPTCKRSNCDLRDTRPQIVIDELLESGEVNNRLLIGAYCTPQSKKAAIEEIDEFHKMGYRRIVTAEKLLRLPTDLSDEKLEDYSVLVDSTTLSRKNKTRVLESLQKSLSLPERRPEANLASIYKLEKDGISCEELAIVSHGYYCKRCSLFLKRGHPGGELNISLKLEASTLKDIKALKLAELPEQLIKIADSTAKTSGDSAQCKTLCGAVLQKLEHISALKLGHLSLNRSLKDLSSGERLKLSLAKLASTKAAGTLIVADDISNCLSRREAQETAYPLLEELRNRGNTLVLGESNPDYFPAAKNNISLPSPELQKTPHAPICKKAASQKRYLELEGICAKRLKVPLYSLVAICGPSGSGKTLLLTELLRKLKNHRREINSVSYVACDHFSQGLWPPKKRVQTLAALLKIDPLLLEIRLARRDVCEPGSTTVEEAIACFRNNGKLLAPLQLLNSLGLGRAKLTEQIGNLGSDHLSRLTCALEILDNRPKGFALLLDQVFCSARSLELSKCLIKLTSLCESGASVLIASHNRELIERAEYVVEL